jgi:hypothetical protein
MLHLPCFSRLKLILLLFFAVIVTGCGRRQGSFEKPEDERHILKMLQISGAYRGEHNNKQPANPEELKSWVKSLSADKLKNLGIEDVDAALTSPRDHKPYLCAPLENYSGRPGRPSIVAYESEGVNGKVMTVGTMGNVSAMTKEDLKKEVPSAPW